MAETKPTKVPRWNEGGSNRTEPPETGSKSKTTGWAVDDEPPSSYFNWLQYYTGAFLKWIDERMFDGVAAHDFTIKSVVSSGDGGDLTLEAAAATGSADGGDVIIKAGLSATSGAGGDISATAGNSVGAEGGDLNLNAGSCLSGAGSGGDISLTAGQGASSQGGLVVINAGYAVTTGSGGAVIVNSGAGAGTSSGGSMTLGAGDGGSGGGDGGAISINGGDGNGAADGGNININGGGPGSTSGFGGDVSITGGSGRQLDGGDINITAGSCIQTSGGGGDITLTGGAAIGGEGGDINLTAGDCGSGTGGGGDITLIAGDGIDNEGGNINLLAGDASGATGDTGGDIVITAGDAVGTNKGGGNIDINAGDSTGTGYSGIDFFAAEAGASGSGVNTSERFFRVKGGAGTVGSYKQHEFISSQTDRGHILIDQKAEPTSPSIGDVYMDSATNQLNVYDGTRYHAINPIVYSMKYVGTPINNTVSRHIYYESNGTTPVAYIIPANSLRVGSRIIVEMFIDYDSGNTYQPGTQLVIQPTLTLPGAWSWTTIMNYTARYFDFAYAKVVVTVGAVGVGGVASINIGSVANLEDNVGLPTTPGKIMANAADIGTNFNTTVANYIFPYAFFGTSTGQITTMRACTVEVA